MNDETLKEILSKISQNRNDKEAIYKLIVKFNPLIKKLAYQLNDDCAQTDLIIFLIEFTHKFDYEQIKDYSEGALVNYIAQALRRKKIDLFRKNQQKFEEIHSETIKELPDETNFTVKITLSQCMSQLSPHQQDILMRKYVEGYSDIEIAAALGISRQAVNRTKTRALAKLRQLWEDK